MMPLVVRMPYSSDKILQIPSSLYSALPSYLSSSHDKCTFSHCTCDSVLHFPPSPPPTNSDPKRSVPLPSLGSNAEAGPSSPVPSRCRLPREISLGSIVELLSFPALMTPPPTVPTQTLALPPAEVDMVPDLYPHGDWDAGFPSVSSFPDHDHSMDHLLSPISPERTTNGTYDMARSRRDTRVLPSGNRIPEPESLPYLQESDDNNTSPHCRPILHNLDIPFQSPNSTFNHSPPSPIDFDEELPPTPNTPDMDMDMDMDAPPTPESLPTSPLVHEFPFPSDERLFGNDFRSEKFRTFFAPPVPELEFLPELDDIPDSPSSPSLRSFSHLPSLYDDDDDDDDGLTSPPSPGATLVPLPGADPEDDAVSPSDRDPRLPGVPASPLGSPSRSLLLLEDEPLPRSPSPENCDVDPAYIEDSADPDIRRLGELRRRSLLAERAARQLEQTLLEQGAVHQRWEARRARKKEKERGREIGAMLRLKMGREREEEKERHRAEGVVVEREREGEEERAVEKGAISSMEQLVAKMLLRRNDTYRSLANRKTPLTCKFHKSSPLVRHGDSVGLDMDDPHGTSNPPPWTGNSESDSGSGLRTLSAWTSPLPRSSLSSF
ncbi:hypothetical protein C0993_005483 [Termitomyces sp. T159_Od127]|nr:hypothetical protein C0993_005483 [Termitomyces sp. T159_Od127]